MLSEHELVEAVRKLYPKARVLEEECLTLFNQAFQPGRGPLGVTGTNELEWTIQYLESTVSYLRRMGLDKGLIKEQVLFFPDHPVVPHKDAWFSRWFKMITFQQPKDAPTWSPETERMIAETRKKGSALVESTEKLRRHP